MKRSHAFTALVLVLLAAVALAVPAHAQTTTYAYDQQDATKPTGFGSLTGSGTFGQSFVPTVSLMDAVTFVINVADNQGGNSGEVAQLSVQLLAGAGLGGQVLATSNTLTLQPDDAFQATRTFLFPATVALTPGNTYTLAVVFGGTAAPDVFVLPFGTTADSYASGQAYPTGQGVADFDFQEGLGSPSLTTLYNFAGSDGSTPVTGLIQANDGNFYGTTQSGGSGGGGTVFQLTPAGGLTVLHNFANNDAGGGQPLAALFEANDGFFYGTTSSTGGPENTGSVFRIDGGGALDTVYVFNFFAEGSEPHAGVIQDRNGNFDGVTYEGDSHEGTVYQVTPEGDFTSLYGFRNAGDGGSPLGGLLETGDGTIYGTASYAGATDEGAVFALTAAGQFSDLHGFGTQDGDGAHPATTLVQGRDGNFYGTTPSGGVNGNGTVYAITPGGTLATLYSFNGTDGADPQGLTPGSDGNLYGVTNNGGAYGNGTIFSLTPDGKTLTTLHDFSAGDPNGFNSDGGSPRGTLVQGSDGNIYGTTSNGGASGHGTAFRVNATLPDVVQFHLAINSVNETAGTATVRVDRIGDNGSLEVLVPYTLTDGTAKAGTDYSDGGGSGGVPGFLVWQEGDVTPKFITVNIVNHGLTDGSLRTLTLALGNPQFIEGNDMTLGYPTTATLTINGSIPGAPVITSAQTATGTEGQPFSYQIVASATPTSYGFQGDPNGLSIDPQTGLISGTPKAAHGALSYTLNAYNAKGKGSAPLTITFAQAQPQITSTLTANATANAPFSYQITASGGDPQRFGVTGLPAGLSVDPATGILSGTRKVPGPVTMSLNAFNSAGEGSASLTINVAQEPVPTITSATTAMETAGQPFSYTITASHDPTSFGVQGLPSGLSVDASTGQITGTRKVPGTVNLTLNAYNSTGKGSQPLTLTVSVAQP